MEHGDHIIISQLRLQMGSLSSTKVITHVLEHLRSA